MKKLLILALWLSSFGVLPAVNAAPNNVVINEIQFDGFVWIEIYNPTNSTIDISRWVITDRNPAEAYPSGKHLYVFTQGSVIKAKSFRVIKEGIKSYDLKFGIDCTRQETIYLGVGSGILWTEIDKVNPPAFEAGSSYGRLTDGGSTWGHTVPTEKAANESKLPKLNGTGSYTCRANKKCTINLTATRSGTFALSGTKAGVTLSSVGTLNITARKKQTLSIPVSISNSYGTTTMTLKIKIA